MNRRYLTYSLLAVFLLIGFFLVLFGVTINGRTMQVIENTSLLVSSGVSIQNFINPIMGVIAKGYITNVAPWIVKVTVVSGILMVYFSLYFGMCLYSERPFTYFVSKDYWLNFSLFIGPKKRIKKKTRKT